MNMIFKAFAKKLFGVKCEKLKRTVFLCLVVFWGLYSAVRLIPDGKCFHRRRDVASSHFKGQCRQHEEPIHAAV